MAGQQTYRVCRVCACDTDNACTGLDTETGRCTFPDPKDDICSRCLPAKGHVVNVTITKVAHGDGDAVRASQAICACGWFSLMPFASLKSGEQDAAIRAHWQAAVGAAESDAA